LATNSYCSAPITCDDLSNFTDIKRSKREPLISVKVSSDTKDNSVVTVKNPDGTETTDPSATADTTSTCNTANLKLNNVNKANTCR
jgi:hypothetical protein